MSLVLLVVTVILVAGLPLEDSIAMLLVMLVHALVGVALGQIAKLVCLPLLPLAVAMLEAVLEFARVTAPIAPLVLSKSMGLPCHVLPHIAIPIGKEVRSIAMA